MTDATQIMSVEQLQSLLNLLQQQGYLTYGPVRREHAIMYDQVREVEDFPVGVQDEQRPGFYGLTDGHGPQLFGHTTSPDSWKKFLFPKEEVLYSATQEDGQLMFKTASQSPQKKAFIGIRSCDLHAMFVQDRVFLEGPYVDGQYASKRSDLLLIAVNCTHSVETCFCTSLNTGPEVQEGYDLVLTEVVDNGNHFFTVKSGSGAGKDLLDNLALSAAQSAQSNLAKAAIAVAAQQSRAMPTEQLKETIYGQLQNVEFWQELGERCLHCANCTLVCPTCFCSSVEEHTDLAGGTHERVRHWDSCFNESHSHMAGGSVRQSPDSRYRQWFSHKLASWQDQFDTLGCTGCGRCISWCPVGIDITQEAINVLNLPQSVGAHHDSSI